MMPELIVITEMNRNINNCAAMRFLRLITGRADNGLSVTGSLKEKNHAPPNMAMDNIDPAYSDIYAAMILISVINDAVTINMIEAVLMRCPRSVQPLKKYPQDATPAPDTAELASNAARDIYDGGKNEKAEHSIQSGIPISRKRFAAFADRISKPPSTRPNASMISARVVGP